METEWIETDAIKKDQSGNALDKFDKWLDKLSGFADKKQNNDRLALYLRKGWEVISV